MSYTDGLEVFAIGMNNNVYHKWCDRIDWPWTEWRLLNRESSANPVSSGESLRALSPG